MAKKGDPRLEGKVAVYKRSDLKEKVLVEAGSVHLVKRRSAAQVAVFSPKNGARFGTMTAMNLLDALPPKKKKVV